MKMTPFGTDYSPEKFLRTPTQTLRTQIYLAENESQRQINSTSISASYICNYIIQIAHSYSGSKKAPPKTNPQDFLPFPAWEPFDSGGAKSDRPSEITRSILKTLLIRRKLPIHVYIALDSKAKEAS